MYSTVMCIHILRFSGRFKSDVHICITYKFSLHNECNIYTYVYVNDLLKRFISSISIELSQIL